MAEVTIHLPNRQTLLVLEPGVEVTAKEAPPSMTYKGQFPTVGMEPMVAFVTYLDENSNELTIETERTVTNDVEISASTERTVESDDLVLVEIEASTRRLVTNDVEITVPTVRNVTSFKVDLEIGTRRDVIVSGDMEIGTARHVEACIEIEGSTVRNVLNDEDSEIDIPTKEYGSFVEKNTLFRIQHDVLNEDVSDNPYFEKQISNLRNAALLTRNQTIIKAINELFVSQREAFLSTFTALEKVNATLGDLVTDKTLRAEYTKMGANSVIDGLVKLSANIDTIIDFIGMQAETPDYYKELGYEDLLTTLKGMNEKIKSIDFQMLQSSSIINGLTDRIIAQEEESDRLRQRIATLEEQNDAFTRSLDLLSRSITTKFNNFTEDVNSRVRSISSSLENVQHAIEGTVTYEALEAYLNSELNSTKSTVQELDNRVTGLEEKVETAFTEEDIADEEEIHSMFDMTAWMDDYEVISGDDIYKMFDKPIDTEGNPLPTAAEKVQGILDVIVDENEIYGMFPDLVEQAEAQQQ